MKRLILFLAEGFEEIEALTVVDVLRRTGLVCHICGTGEEELIKGAHNIQVKSDVNIDCIKVDSYDGIILPGGMPGAENLKEDYRVIEILRKFNEEGKIIAAICAAPIVLQEASIITGKHVTSYPSFEEEFKNSNYLEDPVVQEDNIITSRGPATVFEFVFKILENFITTKEIQQLKRAMLFK
ncbi:4-methyl-5(b-hydroxyethyl)-thiazole monophosphate biosynthesis [Clostridium tetanomorphum]|uniref:DJ-1/PfpI family protein n=1 Tax=Clostridium tetanomorphum TaxID=1553 RepID=A0A923J2G1_CLOTT|nr:DJ-1 family glyoxalase III [Clostridium tetanomorphum]KAJ53458.1 4-methyl-5(B-hydroxyethyl)-thiazole monophosphate biosynthesis enzyme [Clostridium tetanomorphum DSM 665]MBC2398468.1 DJ-1/PfpI family protein [Clostridium tetanomorphum]MBP1865313.1 4-methyl-5(b-hydroxyethyl)-thiazole monophosphate biosynthesis [Clostridium tetanomorphum]NRS85236.1 4-methyl-5(b-hydroxyethyl)-thiazole monophosphate biosynthesis [Clostridium tetanomorphum]NRZ98413.1 4-methyl-5(b-hydroxyethyl)-thiazole monophosp